VTSPKAKGLLLRPERGAHVAACSAKFVANRAIEIRRGCGEAPSQVRRRRCAGACALYAGPWADDRRRLSDNHEASVRSPRRWRPLEGRLSRGLSTEVCHALPRPGRSIRIVRPTTAWREFTSASRSTTAGGDRFNLRRPCPTTCGSSLAPINGVPRTQLAPRPSGLPANDQSVGKFWRYLPGSWAGVAWSRDAPGRLRTPFGSNSCPFPRGCCPWACGRPPSPATKPTGQPASVLNRVMPIALAPTRTPGVVALPADGQPTTIPAPCVNSAEVLEADGPRGPTVLGDLLGPNGDAPGSSRLRPPFELLIPPPPHPPPPPAPGLVSLGSEPSASSVSPDVHDQQRPPVRRAVPSQRRRSGASTGPVGGPLFHPSTPAVAPEDPHHRWACLFLLTRCASFFGDLLDAR